MRETFCLYSHSLRDVKYFQWPEPIMHTFVMLITRNSVSVWMNFAIFSERNVAVMIIYDHWICLTSRGRTKMNALLALSEIKFGVSQNKKAFWLKYVHVTFFITLVRTCWSYKYLSSLLILFSLHSGKWQFAIYQVQGDRTARQEKFYVSKTFNFLASQQKIAALSMSYPLSIHFIL